jgi:thioredoxin-related protein
MNKCFVFLLALVLSGSTVFSQETKKDGIQWMSFTEAIAMGKKEPKKIFIDVYTHWCGWCKKMEASTFQDSAIVAYMNKNFYSVKLDAETKDSIPFGDKVFTYNQAYKANDLAVALLGGNMGYPNFVFLDETFNMLTNVSGFQTVEQLKPTLVYFSDDIYKKMSPEEYQKQQTH